MAGVHTYVDAPLAEIVVFEPLHNEDEPGVAVTVGVVLTVIVLLAVLIQPVALVPVTVYVVVVSGVAVTGVPVVALRPVAGDHEYVDAPPALIVVELPLQIVVTPPPVVTVGNDNTAIARTAVSVQPAALVPVIV